MISKINISLVSIIFLLYSNCVVAEANDRLFGMWKWDGTKTLDEIKKSHENSENNRDAKRALLFVTAQIDQMNNSVRVFFASDKYITIITDSKGNLLSSDAATYHVVESTKDTTTIDQHNNGGIVKLHFSYNYYYIFSKVGDYAYKDFYVKQN